MAGMQGGPLAETKNQDAPTSSPVARRRAERFGPVPRPGRALHAARALAWSAAMAVAGACGAPGWLAPLAVSSETAGPPWRLTGLPGQRQPHTRFTSVTLDGERALRVEASSSYGVLVHDLADPPSGRTLSWRWRVDEPNPRADLRRRDGDDAAVKVCAMFDLPLASVPFFERQLLRLARLRAREDLAAANVCYVWDARLSPGTELDNAYTRRVRFVVLRGPEAPLHAWVRERRDVHADFLHLFADESRGQVPPLVAIAVGADADNTQEHSVAHVADVQLN
jgi:hypothetical protein